MDAPFLPSFPLQLSYPLLFGALLVAGMMGGELARLVRAPRILGYVTVGFVMGPFTSGLGVGDLLDVGRIFVDLALGLVLFELGRRMDLGWMKRDWTLAATGVAESAASFIAVFSLLLALDFEPVLAGLAAAIAMTSSPAVLIFIVHDSRSEGQVTERAFNLVALNGLLSSIIATIMLGSAHFRTSVDLETAVLLPLYLFAGSILLGAAMAGGTRVVARTVERSPEVHFTLIAGMVVMAVGLATLLKLPVILALLAFGMFARNDERGHDLLNVSLAPFGRLMFIVLFVITGASLPIETLMATFGSALAFAGVRAAGKVLGVLAFAPLGGLTPRQAVGLGLALTPMSTLALLMQHDIARLFPEFDDVLSALLLGSILVMEFAGPLAVQFGLRFARETAEDPAATLGPRTLPRRT
jgi:Kef-type K+ transport system membrane component KefB